MSTDDPTGGPPLSDAAERRVALPFILVTLIWSTTWYVIRGQNAALPAVWSVSLRFTIAGAAMMIWAWRRGEARIDARGHLLALAVALAMFVGNYNLVYLAERTVTSGLVAVVFALLVVPNAILGWLVLGQPVSRRFLVGSLIGLVGVGLLFVHELAFGVSGAHAIWAGIGLTLGAVLAASVGSVVQAGPSGRARPIVGLLAWAMVYGAAIDALIGLVSDGIPVLPRDPAFWAGLAYLGLVGSALAFTLYYRIVRAIGPARAAYSSVLTPILAMVISTLLEGYLWTPTAAAGAVLALAGLVVALNARSPSRNEG